MDVSAVTGQSNIGGISQPIIGQRKIEHEIRLRDGEANLLGGIMEDQQTKSLTGIPGLAQIPILKYLFGQTTQDHSENEIVFAIVPHIIRGTEVQRDQSARHRYWHRELRSNCAVRANRRPHRLSGAIDNRPTPSIQPLGNPAPAAPPPAAESGSIRYRQLPV